jgi:hypothetical protein
VEETENEWMVIGEKIKLKRVGFLCYFSEWHGK